MACSIMFLEYGTMQNVINAVIFLIIAAINFQSCVQAVRLILNRRKAAPQGAPSAPPPRNAENGAPRNAPNCASKRETPRGNNTSVNQYKDKRR